MTNDTEYAALRQRRSAKILIFIVVGAILQIAIILAFVLIFMRFRNPKLRLSSVTVESLTVNSSASSPSFAMKLNAQVSVKNGNFGTFKFGNTTATISYRAAAIGTAVIPKSRANPRSTKKMNVTVTVASSGKTVSSSSLGSDIGSGKLTLTSEATLTGKIHLFLVFKKKRSARMNCTMVVNTKSRAIENLQCK